MKTVIQTNHLSKSYKDMTAVNDVSLKINKGEIYGFIGLNGAGKTTTIRMLLGMIKPTAGACYINGERVALQNHQIWKEVGYMVEAASFYPELTVKENLEIYQKLRSMSDSSQISRVMDKLHISRYANKKAKNLSLGNGQRLGIAKALLHDPLILILDEPVNGLDPSGMVEIRELLRDLAGNKGVTILISSHLLSEVSKMATKIGVIHEGTMIQEFEAKELNNLLNKRLIIDTRDNNKAAKILTSEGYELSFNRENMIGLAGKQAIHHPDKLSKLLVYRGVPPTKLMITEEDLESYFLGLVKKKKVTQK